MHLLNWYSQSTALKVDKPFIQEDFIPLSFDKYITFQPFSKPAKNYDYWQQVIDIIKPELDKLNIHIVQLGANGEASLKGCHDFIGSTSLNQAAYLIKRGLLHLGTDSFGIHFASAFNKKIVSLYSIAYKEQCGPFFSNLEDVRIIESFSGEKPPYIPAEQPKGINKIKPEEIAKAVFELLNIDCKTYETISIGQDFHNKFLEVIPDSIFEPGNLKVPVIILRGDIEFNEKVIKEQIVTFPTILFTEKSFDVKEFEKLGKNLQRVVYFLNVDSHNNEFVKQLHESKLAYELVTYETGENLKKLKLYYLDYNPIFVKKRYTREDFISEDKTDLKFTSNKFIISNGKIYNSEISRKLDKSLDGFKQSWQDVIDTEDFWKEANNYHIVQYV